MPDSHPSLSKVDKWFDKWHLPDTKLSSEDARKALEELESLVEEYSLWDQSE